MAKAQDGEAFGLFRTNESLPTEVKLDLRLVEADQISTPDLTIPDASGPTASSSTPRQPGRVSLLTNHPASWA